MGSRSARGNTGFYSVLQQKWINSDPLSNVWVKYRQEDRKAALTVKQFQRAISSFWYPFCPMGVISPLLPSKQRHARLQTKSTASETHGLTCLAAECPPRRWHEPGHWRRAQHGPGRHQRCMGLRTGDGLDEPDAEGTTARPSAGTEKTVLAA